jgi:hypothetical protein
VVGGEGRSERVRGRQACLLVVEPCFGTKTFLARTTNRSAT